jgi:hypothetical protein
MGRIYKDISGTENTYAGHQTHVEIKIYNRSNSDSSLAYKLPSQINYSSLNNNYQWLAYDLAKFIFTSVGV